MAEILLCSQSMQADHLQSQCGISSDNICGLNYAGTGTIEAYRPYLIGQNPSILDQSILSSLGSSANMRNLMDLASTVGQDNLLAIAEIHHELHNEKAHEKHDEHHFGREASKEFAEKSAGVIAHHGHKFVHSVKHYQDSLMAYRKAMKAAPVARMTAKIKAQEAFNKLQKNFGKEVKLLSGRAAARKGTPLNNLERARNIAKSSRNVTKLELVNTVEASKLGKIAKYSKPLGKGIVALDFGMRVNNIRESYQKGENWEREMFVESSSFATAVVAGDLALEAGMFLLMATPVGWVGLIVGGVAVAGVAVAASMTADKVLKENSGDFYDKTMRWLGSK